MVRRHAVPFGKGWVLQLTDSWVWLAGLLNGLAYLISYAGLARMTVSLSAVLVGLRRSWVVRPPKRHPSQHNPTQRSADATVTGRHARPVRNSSAKRPLILSSHQVR